MNQQLPIAFELADRHLQDVVRAERKSNALLVAILLIPTLFLVTYLTSVLAPLVGVDQSFWENRWWLLAGAVTITVLSLAYVVYAYVTARAQAREMRIGLLRSELRFALANLVHSNEHVITSKTEIAP